MFFILAFLYFFLIATRTEFLQTPVPRFPSISPSSFLIHYSVGTYIIVHLTFYIPLDRKKNILGFTNMFNLISYYCHFYRRHFSV